MSKFVEFSLRHSLKHQIHQILISRYLSFRIPINSLDSSSSLYLPPRRDYNQFPSLRRDDNYRSSNLPNKSSSSLSDRYPSSSNKLPSSSSSSPSSNRFPSSSSSSNRLPPSSSPSDRFPSSSSSSSSSNRFPSSSSSLNRLPSSSSSNRLPPSSSSSNRLPSSSSSNRLPPSSSSSNRLPSSSSPSNRLPFSSPSSYSREENNVQKHKYSREEIERIIRPREGEAERNYFSKTKLKSKDAIRSPIRNPFVNASDSYKQTSFHDRDRGERFESRNNIDRMALREKYNNMNSMMRNGKLNDRGYRDSRMNSSRFRTEYNRDDQYKSTINKYKTPDKIPKESSFSAFPIDRTDRMIRIARIMSGGNKKPEKQPIFVNPDYFNNNASIIVENDAPKLSRRRQKKINRIKKLRLGKINDDKTSLMIFDTDFTEWLNILRLSKYAIFFKKMQPGEILKLNDEKLRALRITSGARTKLLQEIARIKELKAQKKHEEKLKRIEEKKEEEKKEKREREKRERENREKEYRKPKKKVKSENSEKDENNVYIHQRGILYK